MRVVAMRAKPKRDPITLVMAMRVLIRLSLEDDDAGEVADAVDAVDVSRMTA
jgi:hypothetical protein